MALLYQNPDGTVGQNADGTLADVTQSAFEDCCCGSETADVYIVGYEEGDFCDASCPTGTPYPAVWDDGVIPYNGPGLGNGDWQFERLLCETGSTYSVGAWVVEEEEGDGGEEGEGPYWRLIIQCNQGDEDIWISAQRNSPTGVFSYSRGSLSSISAITIAYVGDGS